MKKALVKIAVVLGMAAGVFVATAVIGASVVSLSAAFAENPKNCMLVGAIGFLTISLYGLRSRRKKQ